MVWPSRTEPDPGLGSESSKGLEIVDSALRGEAIESAANGNRDINHFGLDAQEIR